MSNVKSVPIKTLKLFEGLVNREHKPNATAQALADDVANHGIKKPLIVRPAGDFYEVVCGLKRWKAALIADLSEVPVDIRNLTDEQALQLSITDNLD